MSENINEDSETTPMPSQDASTEPQAPRVPEPAYAAPVSEPMPAPAGYADPAAAPAKKTVTISHRALWIGAGVIVGLIVLSSVMGLGVMVGRHAGGFDRARGEALIQAPGGPGECGRQRDAQSPRPWGDDDRGDEQGWRGGQGFRGMPRGQLPTGTPSP